ncbi:MAG TPA: L-seryl-tRNA(Sec) selenium transferase, partial [Clostridiales bacterium UBA8960]|nr:L-seryl-tRNA(Sec) selenium transferase [Clostridiales bacterium UBA8960]
ELEIIGLKYSIEAMMSQVGGGALPLEELPSYGLCLRGDFNLNRIQYALRQLPIPIILKIEDDAMYLDFRTLFTDDYAPLIDGLSKVMSGGTN